MFRKPLLLGEDFGNCATDQEPGVLMEKESECEEDKLRVAEHVAAFWIDELNKPAWYQGL